MNIKYPVRATKEDEDADQMIADASGRALDVDEIVAAMNGSFSKCQCGRYVYCDHASRRDDCPNLGKAMIG